MLTKKDFVKLANIISVVCRERQRHGADYALEIFIEELLIFCKGQNSAFDTQKFIEHIEKTLTNPLTGDANSLTFFKNVVRNYRKSVEQ